MKAIFPRTRSGIAACVCVTAIIVLLLVNAGLGMIGFPPTSRARADVAVVLVAVRIATIFAVMAWTVRITKNVHALGHRGLPISPRAAFWFWFVPFLNIMHGYRVTAQAWIASDPTLIGKRGRKEWDEESIPRILKVWWTACLVARSVSTLAEIFMPELVNATILVEATAAVLMFVVTRRVDDRQAEARSVYESLPKREKPVKERA